MMSCLNAGHHSKILIKTMNDMNYAGRDRTIKVDKANLIKAVKENKKRHIAEFKKGVTAYKKKVQKEIEEQSKHLKDGNFEKIGFHLTQPEDRSTDYDKVVKMFEWEVKTKVQLTQSEFNEYINDETNFAIGARMSNTMYLATT